MNGLLTGEFIVPPYSVINRRAKVWQARSRAWRSRIGYGIATREGSLSVDLSNRLPDLYIASKAEREKTGMSFKDYVSECVDAETLEKETGKQSYSGVSAFDPTLAEIIYRWFTPYEGCNVFDCFAGGVTKGAVACGCGHNFTGIELREEQVAVNNLESSEMSPRPRYIVGDGRNVCDYLGEATQDLLISCPPYYDLEVYSGLPDDASNQKSYGDFMKIIESAFTSSVKCLKNNRFAVAIVGDFRDKNGECYDFSGDVVRVFRNAGCVFWNEMIIVNDSPLYKIRARKYMKTRKIVRVHEKALVFYKGNPRGIVEYFSGLKEIAENPDVESEQTANAVISRRLRDMGISQGELCREMGISNSALSMFIRHGTHLSVARFAAILDRLGLAAVDSDGEAFDMSEYYQSNVNPLEVMKTYRLKITYKQAKE